MPRDLYETLGVRPTASTETIKRAYRRLAKRYHPDLNKARGAKEMFLEVKEAYEVLSNPLLRREYDERVGRGSRGTPWEPPRPAGRRGSPMKVRVPPDYVRVSPPFGFHGVSDRLTRAQDHQIERRARTAKLVWRVYVITVLSMSSMLLVGGAMNLAAGGGFAGGITLAAAAMMLMLLLIAWLAKGIWAPDL